MLKSIDIYEYNRIIKVCYEYIRKKKTASATNTDGLMKEYGTRECPGGLHGITNTEKLQGGFTNVRKN